MEKNELNNKKTDSAANTEKNKIRSSKLQANAKTMSSTRVLQGEEADEALSRVFGEKESKLDNALKKSLGLEKDDKMSAADKKKPVSRLRSVLSFLLTLAICVVLALLFTRFVVQRNTVVGQSMEPTLMASDELFVEKISHIWNDYDRGTLITARVDEKTAEGEPMIVIKRIIGLPGDSILISEGSVFINGAELDEFYLDDNISMSVSGNFSLEVILDENEYFIMGDNRPDSYDSRHFGPIKEDALVGKVWFRFYPFDRFGKP